MDESLERGYMKDKYMEMTYAPRGRCSSVHYSACRYEKALEQAKLQPTELSKVDALVIQYLKSINIIDEKYKSIIGPLDIIDYDTIQKEYALDDVRDLVWIKCTVDGFIGVVAVSNDVNLDIPASDSEYDLRDGAGKWVHTTAGILIHKVGKTWDSEHILVFPLPHMRGKAVDRHHVETGVGNYLLANGVAIIDYYSHRY